MDLAARRARRGVTLLFFLNGVSFMSLAPRYPQIKAGLDLSDQGWGLVLAIGPIGGLVAGLATAHLMRRFTSARVASLAQLLGVLMINAVANAPTVAAFAVALFLILALDALCDIAMNAHGLRVQRRYGRSIYNAFHAWWSVGAVTGGLLGSAFLQAGASLPLQGLVTSLVFAALTLHARTLLLPGPDRVEQPVAAGATSADAAPAAPAVRRGWSGVRTGAHLLALGVLGGAAGLVEDVGASWSAIYIDRSFEVAPFVVGMGFVALQGGQTLGRFLGDGIVEAVGRRTTVVLGALLAGVGMGVALALPSPATTIAGFACAGWGVATVVPAAMQTADELPGLRPGTGLTVMTWTMRFAFLVGPPMVGALAEATTLRTALLVVPACALLVLVLSPCLQPGEREALGRSARGERRRRRSGA